MQNELLTLAALEQQARNNNVAIEVLLQQARSGFTHECHFCKVNGEYEGESVPPAVRGMPQSSDLGKTVEVFGCCASHVIGWWDGADWDGRTLEVDLTNKPNIILFHDRGAGREIRHFIGGRVVFRDDPNNEMLSADMVREVEKLIANGQLSGSTGNACYPDWALGYMSA